MPENESIFNAKLRAGESRTQVRRQGGRNPLTIQYGDWYPPIPMFGIDFSFDRGSGVPLHEQLVARLRHALRRGELRDGERLPASRELAARLGVNRGTVQKAYATLVAAGEARAGVGRGTFITGEADAAVQRDRAGGDFSPLPPPPTVEDPEWQRLARWSTQPGMISFAGGMPDEQLFPVAPFRDSLHAALSQEGSGLLQYGPSRGHPAFLDILARRLAARGLPIPAERLLVVSGSQQGLDLVARLFITPGDVVVVEEPTYSGALALFRMLGARLVSVPVDEDGMQVDRLAALLSRQRPCLVYTIANFHNPTGQTLSWVRRRRLLKLCADAGVPVVEDDSDGELAYEGDPPPPLAAHAGAHGVVYIGTSSKLLFPGLRLGWVAADEQVIGSLEAVKRVADLHTPPLLQAAMAHFMATEACQQLVLQVRATYRRRRDVMLAALEENMPDGVTWTRPRGGLSLMVDLPAGIGAGELLTRAAGEGVVFAPGSLFSATGAGMERLRLTFGGIPEERLRQGVARLAAALRQSLERHRAPGGRRTVISAPPLV